MHTYINGVTLNKSNNKKQSGGVVSHYCTNSNRLYLLQLRIDDSKKNKKILYNFCWFCQLLALPCLFLHLLRVHQGRGGWENNGRCFPHLASSIQHMTSAIQIDASKVCLRIEVQVRGVQGSSVDDRSLPQKVASKPEVRRLWNGPCECKCVLGLKCVCSEIIMIKAAVPLSPYDGWCFMVPKKALCTWWIAGFSWLCIPITKCKTPKAAHQ